MRETAHSVSAHSPASAYVAAALLAALLVVACYPMQFAIAAMVVGAVLIVSRTAWRRATTRGITLPGAAARLRVDSTERHGSTRWALTISVVEDY